MPADEARSRNAVMGSALHGLATAHRRGRSNAQDCAISDRYWAWRPWRLRQSARRRSPSQPGTSVTSGSLCSAGSNAMSSQVGSTCRSVSRASGRKSPVPAACSMAKSIPPEVIWSATVANDSPGGVDDGGQPGPDPPHATLVAQRHQARECGARPRKGWAQDEAPDAATDGGRQQDVPGRATTQILLRWHAPRQARDVG
jgi:hypothetical protein